MHPRLLDLLHPRLGHLAPQARRSALREANREPFDPVELVAMAAVVILAAWMARGGLTWLPVVLLAAASVLARRWRRGLHRVLGR